MYHIDSMGWLPFAQPETMLLKDFFINLLSFLNL